MCPPLDSNFGLLAPKFKCLHPCNDLGLSNTEHIVSVEALKVTEHKVGGCCVQCTLEALPGLGVGGPQSDAWCLQRLLFLPSWVRGWVAR